MRRRDFLKASGAAAFGAYVAACHRRVGLAAPLHRPRPLLPHPTGLAWLPEGFTMTVLQRIGMPLHDGNPMPGQPDGMACFPAGDGRVTLLRNHELPSRAKMLEWGYDTEMIRNVRIPQPAFSNEHFGGVTRLVVDLAQLHRDLSSGTLVSTSVTASNQVLSGTNNNCSGGVVDGAWVSCEETSDPGFGYAFITRPDDDKVTAPRRIDRWGRFHREGVARDPNSGAIYMTEDREDGCLYRFVPADKNQPFGEGRLEALAVEGVAAMRADVAPGARHFADGSRWSVRWVAVPDSQASSVLCRVQAQRAGGTSFRRCEGIEFGDGLWFVATRGGGENAGQVFRFDPRSDTLTMVLEVTDRSVLSCPDNISFMPSGDLLLCEDNYEIGNGATHQCLRGLRADGSIYDVARNTLNTEDDAGPEFTGPCWSPDGRVLFVNLQRPVHATLAIRGPW
jgi:uncharacterized protein